MLIFSIIFNFSVGAFLSRKNKNVALLFVGISVNLAFLGYFKYTNFFIDNINLLTGGGYNVSNILLPLAISFFTFQQIAYLVDAYKNEAHEYSFLQYSLFVTFFPQLIAGPIVHHGEMLPQFRKKETFLFNMSNVNKGLAIFIIGLFKKVVLADSIAAYATPVFAAGDTGLCISFFEAWGGAFAYTLQLYFDFSGYADMAIGIALMFGIYLPLNFNSPYRSKSIIDFWRRWHMTLSRFLKDYLYIPLGGARKGSKHLNIFLTMLIGGLWHGAAWNFILWGALHGLYIITNHLWRAFRCKVLGHNLNDSTTYGLILSTSLTFLAVVISWVFFRAETYSGAMNILAGMTGSNGFILPEVLSSILPSFFTTGISFEGTGIGSFPSLWGAVWIVLLLIVVFFTPNSHEIVSKCSVKLARRERKQGIDSVFSAYLVPTLYGVCFFISIKVMFTVTDSEFLYFNF